MTHDITQWRRDRLGYVTASRAKDVLTDPSTAGVYELRQLGDSKQKNWVVFEEGEQIASGFQRREDADAFRKRAAEKWKANHWSDTAKRYCRELVTERIIGQPCDLVTSKATDWGIKWEEKAYQRARNYLDSRYKCLLPETKQLEFVHHKTEPWIGCSPDGTVFDGDIRALLELKCPANPSEHLRTIQDGMPDKHTDQIQFSLWCTNMEVYWFGSYDHRWTDAGMEWWCCTATKDPEWESKHVPRILRFRDWVDSEYRKLVEEPF